MGFARAPSTAKLQKPALPHYEPDYLNSGTSRRVTAIKRSLRPETRPVQKPGRQLELILAKVSETKTQPNDILKALKAATSNKIKPQVSANKTPEIVKKVSPRARPAKLSFVSTLIINSQKTKKIGKSLYRTWSINVGKFNTRYQAERVLVRTALAEERTLNGADRTVKARATGYDAIFSGLTRDSADLACRRLNAQEIPCYTVSPS